jgi:hydroxylamine reductase
MFTRLTTRGLVQQARRASTTTLARPLRIQSARLLRPLAASVNPHLTPSNNAFSTVSSTVSNPDMFCRQCEQTTEHYACTTVGVCGKTPETAAVQDVLMDVVKAVSVVCKEARAAGKTVPREANVWTLQATFSTLTNVNFSEDRIVSYIQEGMALLKELGASEGSTPKIDPSATLEDLEEFGRSVSVPKRQEAMNQDDCFSLNEIGTYGIKGACAYAAHCYQLGLLDEDVMAEIHQVFAKLASNEADMEGLLANALKVGEINAKIMGMLDQGHADAYGNPEPTEVRTTAVKGKCILVSGHDFVDLEALLKQTEGTGINVFTHGEMLPAHAHPKLKQYPHLAGNYGTAWQNQKFEFAMFPGPIIVTTNCISEPRRSYRKRLFTTNEVGVDGVQHIGGDRDFSKVIAAANKEKGFPRTVEKAEYHTVGFNHRVVLPMAGQVIEAVQSGALSRIVLIGGCDGSQWDRK